MIKVKFVDKYKGDIIKEFENEEAIHEWVDKNLFNYNIYETYELKDDKWIQV